MAESESEMAELLPPASGRLLAKAPSSTPETPAVRIAAAAPAATASGPRGAKAMAPLARMMGRDRRAAAQPAAISAGALARPATGGAAFTVPPAWG